MPAALLVLMGGLALTGGSKVSAGVFPKSLLEKTIAGQTKIEKLYKAPEKEAVNFDAPLPQIKWNDNYNDNDLRYMSAIIFCEANNMSHDAQVAVANVIINRKNNTKDFGHCSTIKEVIYDDKWGVQFSPIKGSPSSMDKALELFDNVDSYKGTWRYDYMKKCIKSAKAAFSGEKAVPDSYRYFNGAIESSKAKCEANGKEYKIIDGHIYY